MRGQRGEPLHVWQASVERRKSLPQPSDGLMGGKVVGSDNGTGQTRKTAPVSGASVLDIFLVLGEGLEDRAAWLKVLLQVLKLECIVTY